MVNTEWNDQNRGYADIGEWGFTPLSLVGAEVAQKEKTMTFEEQTTARLDIQSQVLELLNERLNKQRTALEGLFDILKDLRDRVRSLEQGSVSND